MAINIRWLVPFSSLIRDSRMLTLVLPANKNKLCSCLLLRDVRRESGNLLSVIYRNQRCSNRRSCKTCMRLSSHLWLQNQSLLMQRHGFASSLLKRSASPMVFVAEHSWHITSPPPGKNFFGKCDTGKIDGSSIFELFLPCVYVGG